MYPADLPEPDGYDSATLSKPKAPKGQGNSLPVGAEVNSVLDFRVSRRRLVSRTKGSETKGRARPQQWIDNSNFTCSTYAGHAWGPYVRLKDGQDDRGFNKHDSAVEFLAFDLAAVAANVKWRALYNDFDVAEEVKPQLVAGSLGYVPHHGPAPYVLHIHIDVSPNAPTPSAGGAQAPGGGP